MCKKELGGRLETEDEFWDCFREAMRKLAARCRRVRHAKKVRSPKIQDLVNDYSQRSVPALHMLNAGEALDAAELAAELAASPEPRTPQTPLSSPSRNSSSTPTPSSSSKPDS